MLGFAKTKPGGITEYMQLNLNFAIFHTFMNVVIL